MKTKYVYVKPEWHQKAITALSVVEPSESVRNSIKILSDITQLPKDHPKFDFILAGSEPYLAKHLMDMLGSNGIVVKMGTGYDNIELDAAKELGIRIFTCGHVESMMKSICEYDEAMVYDHVKRPWNGRKDLIASIDDISIGLIGCGRIGNYVCSYSRLHDRINRVYDPRLSKCVNTRYEDVLWGLDAVIKCSDVILVHIPLEYIGMDGCIKSNECFLNGELLSKMKAGACLVNASREDLIDWEWWRNKGRSEFEFTNRRLVVDSNVSTDKCGMLSDALFMTDHVAAYGKCRYDMMKSCIETICRLVL